MKVGDSYAVNRASFKQQAELAERRFEYLIQKRDTMQGRVRLGVLTLNGASLVGILAIAKDGAPLMLGLTSTALRYAAIGFVIGLIASALSIWIASLYEGRSSAFAFERMTKASMLLASFEAELNEENERRMMARMDEFHGTELSDFGYSKCAMWLQNLGGSFWLVAVAYIGLVAGGWVGSPAPPTQDTSITPPAASAPA
jgi:hypothetical protein